MQEKIKELQTIIKELCTPAKVYLGVSTGLMILSLIGILSTIFPDMKNINSKTYFNILFRFLFSICVIIWTTFIFELLCDNNYTWIPWTILGIRSFSVLLILILYGNILLNKK
jgi:hypothetical protein